MSYDLDQSQRAPWPTTPDGRRKERRRRIDAALGLDYTDDELKMLGAFQARNGSAVIHRTRRIGGAGRFVTQVDAAALASSLSLDLTDDARDRIMVPAADGATPDEAQRATEARREAAASVRLDRALQVWRRSDVDDLVETWAWQLASGGDLLFEVVEDKQGAARIVAHWGDRFDVLYDRFDQTPATAEVRFDYTEGVATDGSVESHQYRRWMDAETKRTWLDGDEAKALPHPLGVCPVVHVHFKRAHDPSLGLHAAHGVELAQTVLDSVATQFVVLGTRAANPMLLLLGNLLASGDDRQRLDKVLNLDQNADAKWLEPAFNGLNALRELAADVRATIEREFPEYLFVDSGASSSGTALSYRAGAFKMKIEPVQRRFWNAIARALAMAVCMEDGVAYDPEVHDVYVVTGGPALPEDRSALVDLHDKLLSMDAIRFVDVIRAFQGAGIVPADRSAEEYAADVEAEAGPRNERMDERAVRLLGGGQDAQPMAGEPMAVAGGAAA